MQTLEEVRSIPPAYSDADNGPQASQQLLVFLHNFYDVFPEYKSMEVNKAVLINVTSSQNL